MPRPRNEASREAISKAALTCFIEIGYDATTYDQISKRSGISRPLVQHYFPRKSQLAQGHLAKLLNQCVELSGDLVPTLFRDAEAEGARLFIIGQIYFGYLCTTGKLLFTDLLRSRELTSEVVDLYPVLPKVDVPGSPDREEIPEGYISALGGFYELAFFRLSTGKSFDVTEALSSAISKALESAGISHARANRVISESMLSPAELKDLLSSIQF